MSRDPTSICALRSPILTVPSRADLVAEARSWRDTPHVWQQAARGRACDCFGFIFGAALAVGLPEAKIFLNRKRNYRTDFSPALMLAGLEEALQRVYEAQPGDLFAIQIGKVWGPRHLAMMTEPGQLIHSYGGGVGKVVEVPIGKSRPIHSIWTWPSLAGA